MGESDDLEALREQMTLALRFYGVPAIGVTDCARVARDAVEAERERLIGVVERCAISATNPHDSVIAALRSSVPDPDVPPVAQ